METKKTVRHSVFNHSTPFKEKSIFLNFHPYQDRVKMKKPSKTRNVTDGMEQVKGIEPSSQAWEACILPMNYTCKSVSLL